MDISILGCGWLGLPLAQHLITRGHTVKGSTTSPEKMSLLKQNDIDPFLIRLTPQPENPESHLPFWNSDVLVLNIPPGRKRENVIDFHTSQIRSVTKAVAGSTIKFVVFVSSTSVYPERSGVVTENDAVPGKAKRRSGNALLKAEQLLFSHTEFETTVVRFGGLIGPDRHPAKYLAGRRNLKRGNAPVNLIHRNDCIEIISRIIENEVTGEVFNAVNDNHQSREEYYIDAAQELGLEPPQFKKDENKNYKIVNNQKLKSFLSYQFK